jgi:hypothetical protein
MFVHFFEKCPLYESHWIIFCDEIRGEQLQRKKTEKNA